MALRTFVKISGITNLSDARYCAGMYVNLIGFSLEEGTEKFVNPAQYKEITGWVSGLEFVGEFDTLSASDALEILKDYPSITWVEHTRIDDLVTLKKAGYQVIYKKDLAEVKHMEKDVATKLQEEGILFHITSNDDPLTLNDKEVISLLTKECEVILGAGVSSENVIGLIDELNLKGIVLEGGEEIKPGLKDFDELADILEVLEIEE
ncbi:phosphoribosylanthranilate isomerase [Algoriphagus halophilus]|uniref:phosphoribosylanthranilate isomerase n=1 Tax=Algoriphagus halophilus TaxID=226505 RepID=A0A1N6DPE5_9BACT|nr:phosphoribosylanthranilate isomerase [Algoriphagus halophilus]SIN72554.1 phosphoribosylanthranilate isomerase [Algoriphagus halophilus]